MILKEIPTYLSYKKGKIFQPFTYNRSFVEIQFNNKKKTVNGACEILR